MFLLVCLHQHGHCCRSLHRRCVRGIVRRRGRIFVQFVRGHTPSSFRGVGFPACRHGGGLRGVNSLLRRIIALLFFRCRTCGLSGGGFVRGRESSFQSFGRRILAHLILRSDAESLDRGGGVRRTPSRASRRLSRVVPFLFVRRYDTFMVSCMVQRFTSKSHRHRLT